MNAADFGKRPIDEHGFAVDAFPAHETPAAAVTGGIAVVAQNKIVIRRDHSERHRLMIPVSLENVGLVQLPVVYVHVAAHNSDWR